MTNVKTFTNQKFPNTTIDVIRESVFGGGVVIQKVANHPPQRMAFGRATLEMFLDEITKSEWR